VTRSFCRKHVTARVGQGATFRSLQRDESNRSGIPQTFRQMRAEAIRTLADELLQTKSPAQRAGLMLNSGNDYFGPRPALSNSFVPPFWRLPRCAARPLRGLFSFCCCCFGEVARCCCRLF